MANIDFALRTLEAALGWILGDGYNATLLSEKALQPLKNELPFDGCLCCKKSQFASEASKLQFSAK